MWAGRANDSGFSVSVFLIFGITHHIIHSHNTARRTTYQTACQTHNTENDTPTYHTPSLNTTTPTHHSTPQHTTAEHSTAHQHNTAQHSTTQHYTITQQHNTTQQHNINNNTAQYNTNTTTRESERDFQLPCVLDIRAIGHFVGTQGDPAE